MAKSICLTDIEASVIIDVMYDFLGQYSAQAQLNNVDAAFDDTAFRSIISKIQESDGCMTIDCEDVAGCIDTPNVIAQITTQIRNITSIDETVINNIVNRVNGSINNANSFYEVTNVSVLTEINPLSPDYEGQLWAGISALVDYCNRANLDFLQTIEAATNAIELSGIIAEATPAIGDQLGSIIALADKVIEFASENYVAYETEEILTALKCRLFCEFREQSQVSLQDIVSVILIQGAESVLNFDFDDYKNVEEIAGVFDLIADLGTLDDEVIFWSMWMLQFAFYTFQNVFFGVSSWASLFRRFEIARLVPNNGYLACVDCVDAPPIPTFNWSYTNRSTPLSPPVGWTFSANRPLMVVYFNYRGYGIFTGGGVNTSTMTMTMTFPLGRLNILDIWGFRNSTTPTTQADIVLTCYDASDNIVFSQTKALVGANNVVNRFLPSVDCVKYTVTLVTVQNFGGVCCYRITVNP